MRRNSPANFVGIYQNFMTSVRNSWRRPLPVQRSCTPTGLSNWREPSHTARPGTRPQTAARLVAQEAGYSPCYSPRTRVERPIELYGLNLPNLTDTCNWNWGCLHSHAAFARP